ncbi:MAG: tRNA pseudouridine(38-40) synthase TruA [Acidobacteriota bacterium]
MSLEHTYRATVQYLGTRYQGWQIQRGAPTIQGCLTEVLSRLAGHPVSVTGSGRTDAGVHALGQVVCFRFPQRESVPDLRRALNANLPWDIRVLSVRRVRSDFDAQMDASRKRYEYRIYNGRVLPPFLYGRVCHVPLPLDRQRMDRAARAVEGRHDFSGFAAASTTAKTRVREVYLSRVLGRGRMVVYRVEANGFLHHMVRNLAGTLIEIGLGKRAEDSLESILEGRDRTRAGPTAEAHGLYLVRVWY